MTFFRSQIESVRHLFSSSRPRFQACQRGPGLRQPIPRGARRPRLEVTVAVETTGSPLCVTPGATEYRCGFHSAPTSQEQTGTRTGSARSLLKG